MAKASVVTSQRQHYTDFYLGYLQNELDWAIAYVQENRPPVEIRQHMQAWLGILRQCRRPELHSSVVMLTSLLHPFPLDWGYWTDWEEQLNFATNVTQEAGQKAQLLAHLSRIMFLTGRRETALEFGKRAFSNACSADDIVSLTKSGVMVGSILLEHLEAQNGSDILNFVEQEIVKKELQGAYILDAAVARTHFVLQKTRRMRQEGYLDAALALLNDSIDHLKSIPEIDPTVPADVYSARSVTHWLQGNSLSAIDDLNQAIDLVSRTGYESEERAFRGNLGLCYRTAGQLKQAEEILLNCILLAERSRTYYRLSFDLGSLALVFLSQGRIEDALVSNKRHIALAKDYSSPAENMRAQDIFGMIKFYAGDYMSAQIVLEKNLPYYESQTGKLDLILQLAYLSGCYKALGKTDQAISAAEKGFDYAEQQNLLPPKIFALRALAEVRTPSQSKVLLNQALALSHQCHRLLDEAACLISLAGVEENKEEQKKLWDSGEKILQEIGASLWVEGCSPLHLPKIPVVM